MAFHGGIEGNMSVGSSSFRCGGGLFPWLIGSGAMWWVQPFPQYHQLQQCTSGMVTRSCTSHWDQRDQMISRYLWVAAQVEGCWRWDEGMLAVWLSGCLAVWRG